MEEMRIAHKIFVGKLDGKR